MSQKTGSSIKHTEIYVQLLNEGTKVYRPAPAFSVGPNVVIILLPDTYDPEDEEWEFKPGTTVRTRPQTFSDGEVWPVAVAKVR